MIGTTMIQILPATSDHHAAISAIWMPVIRDTTAIFHTDERSPARVSEIIAARRDAGKEFWVALDGETVQGFASYDRFRSGDGYDHTMEHSIFLTPEAQGRGVGRALMDVLEAHALSQGVRVMVAAIDADNTAAQAFHAALGYAVTGRMPGVGRKFGRWLDLVLMQKLLGEPELNG